MMPRAPDIGQIHHQLVGSVITKFCLLVSFAAGLVALLVARHYGCEWMQSLWRCVIAAAVSGIICMMVIQPLHRALRFIPRPAEPEGEQAKPPDQGGAPGGGA